MRSLVAGLAVAAFVLVGTGAAVAQCYDYLDAPRILHANLTPPLDSSNSLARYQDHIYLSVTTQGHLRAYDVADPTHPVLVSTVTAPGVVDPVVVGDRLVASSVASLVLFDLADPDHPALLGMTASPGGLRIQDFAVDGDRVLSVSRNYLEWSYVTLWDISGDVPVVLGSPTSTLATDCVALQGDWGYVGATSSGWLWPVDLQNPADPVLSSPATVVPDLAGFTTLDATDECLVAIGPAAGNSFRVVTLVPAPPLAPMVASVLAPGGHFRTASLVGDVLTLVDEYSASDRYRWIDCADPYALVLGGGAQFPERSPYGVVREGEICYIAGYSSGLQILRTGWDPLPVTHDTGASVRFGEAAAIGDYVYIAKADTLATALIVYDAESREYLPSLNLPGAARQLASNAGSLIAVATEDELVIVDASSPAQPTVRGSVAIDDIAELRWDDPATVYAVRHGATADNLVRIDVTDPQAPAATGVLSTLALAGPFAVADGWVYLASGADPDHVEVVDFRVPTAPAYLGHLTTDITVAALAIADQHLYVVDPYNQFLVFDLADPAQPEPLAALELPDPNPYQQVVEILGLVIEGTTAYVGGPAGVSAVDLSDPAQPAFLGFLPVTFSALGYLAQVPVIAAGQVVVPFDYYFGARVVLLPLHCTTTAVSETPPASGALRAWPNPFNPRVTFSFTLASAQTAEFAIYDLAGRRVAVLADGTLAAGPHAVVWDGADTTGRALASGVYLARLRAGDRHDLTRVTLVR